MKKSAKIIRIITVSPFMVMALILTLYFGYNSFFKNNVSYLIVLATLVALPLLAYPIQSKFNVIKNMPQRKAERTLAIIFSIVGYVIGFTLAFVLKTPSTEKIFFLTYLLSVLFISILSFIFKFNASGHMAGVSGPITIILYLFGFKYLFIVALLVVVIWASMQLDRHTILELIAGSLIPVVSLIISFLIFGII